jgi:hypothetical protein
MSSGEAAGSTPARAGSLPWGAFLDREHVLGYVLVFPALLLLGVFIAYPFLLGIWFSLTDKIVGQPANFIGLRPWECNREGGGGAPGGSCRKFEADLETSARERRGHRPWSW